jgi:hypothetical protein
MEVPGVQGDRTISDPVVIQKIRAFADARKDRWEMPFPDTPVAPLRLNVYQGDRGISYLAIGKTFIEAPGCNYVASRKITSNERHEILAILGLSDSVLR